MYKVEVEISDERIAEVIEQEMVRNFLHEGYSANFDARRGVKSGIDAAVRKYIYKQKDYIIERVVDRAAAEMVRKGLPKLLERMDSNAG